MTLQQLKYVVVIAETKSMNKAAAQLKITQPSISNSVKELENELGITIFLRSRRGISLTEDGKEFLGYANKVMDQYTFIVEHYTKSSLTGKAV